ncbi:MAG: secretin N-terminal domain-containing protein [Planctomycetia bacterium]|nr:secretin N-terminal domain-containing protein [Planctomycetia bacterium]
MTWRNRFAGILFLAAASAPYAAGQAPPSRPAARVAEEPLLHAYSFPAPQLERAYADLAKEFGRERNAKFAIDRRTMQVLVVAPPSVHAKIVAWLNPEPPAETRPVAPSAPALTPLAQNQQPIRLEAKLWPALAASLEQIWHKSLSKPTSRIGEISRYKVQLDRGGEVELEFDPRQGTLIVNGQEPYVSQASRLIEALLAAPSPDGNRTKVVPVVKAPPEKLRMALTAYQTGAAPADAGTTAVRRAPRTDELQGTQLTQLFQQPAEGEEDEEGDQQLDENGQPIEEGQPGDQPEMQPPGDETPPTAEDLAALLGQVRIEYIEGMDAIIITGRQADVEKVQRIIDEIEQIAAQTVPVIEIYPLENANSEAVATMVTTLYDTMLQPRQGRVSITPLVKPNSLLLIGRRESVDSALELIKRLDQPVDPQKQFEIFRLRHASATEVQTLITQFYQQRGQAGQGGQGGAGQEVPGLSPRVIATADYRTNSLIVQAAPRDLAEVGALIQRMDDPTSAAENELRVVPLQNTMAEEMQQVLQNALTATTSALCGRGGQGGGQGFDGGGGQQSIVPSQGGGATGSRAQQMKSTALRFMAIDSEGRRQLQSGVLSDVRITAEPRSNSLLVSAPAASMELLEALIKQLDQPPAAAAQVKVFTIIRGDASALAELLQGLFGQAAAGGQGRGGQQQQARLVVGTGEGGGVLPVRFSIDTRTNSIIAAGSEGDLRVVEAILLRLDESDLQQRETQVYRLRNAPADAIAESVNEFLRTERETQQLVAGASTAFEQIEREVVVVPELVSNSLIVSATPRYFPEIQKLVTQLDARPPMVMIQVLIAEVALNNTDEFGVELGLQDSLLFDRSFLDNITNIQQTSQTSTPAGVVTNTTTQLQTATLSPGFAFNNQSLGNAVSTSALRNSGQVAGQALSNFSVNRTNNDLGFGGLVLSASSESVSILIRALQESRRLDVLSRPQIMTLDNQPAYVQVGERVPTITGTQLNETGQINNVQLEDVGLILGVTPRTSPDNLVVMEVDAQKSALGPEAEGIPVSISATGEVVRQPRIEITQAQTTVSAHSGQTIVIGGLLTNRRSQVHRRVPLLASIPVLGNLFRYDSVSNEKTELLIILTPHVVRTKEEAETLKQVEAGRMNWCLADVRKIHGYGGMRGRGDDWEEGEVMTIYPDQNLDGTPTLGPNGTPMQAPFGEPTLAPVIDPTQNGQAPMLGPPSGGVPPGVQPQANQLQLRPHPDPQVQRTSAPPAQRPPQQQVQPVNYQAPQGQR